jgi:hypothetical protein
MSGRQDATTDTPIKVSGFIADRRRQIAASCHTGCVVSDLAEAVVNVAEQITDAPRPKPIAERVISGVWWACMAGLAVNVVVGVALMFTGHPGAFVPSVLVAFGSGSVGYLLGRDLEPINVRLARRGR